MCVRLHNTDVIPSYVEFVGDNHRQRRTHTLAHIDFRDPNRDTAVRVNLHEGVKLGRIATVSSQHLAHGVVAPVNANGETTASDAPQSNKVSAIDPGDVVHDSMLPAAR